MKLPVLIGLAVVAILLLAVTLSAASRDVPPHCFAFRFAKYRPHPTALAPAPPLDQPRRPGRVVHRNAVSPLP